jgi:hypothetical protein
MEKITHPLNTHPLNTHPLNTHPLSAEAIKYIESMTPDQKALHELAIEKLGSSYFVERTRGFEEYMKTKK